LNRAGIPVDLQNSFLTGVAFGPFAIQILIKDDADAVIIVQGGLVLGMSGPDVFVRMESVKFDDCSARHLNFPLQKRCQKLSICYIKVKYNKGMTNAD